MHEQKTVEFLYRFLLRRDPDPLGLAHWLRVVEQEGIEAAFRAIWQSHEFASLPAHSVVRSPPGARSVYFFHIPKTAGISVHRYLEWALAPEPICPAWGWDELAQMPEEEVSRYRVFRGHFQGYLTDYLQRPLLQLTLLRDPVERTISCYSYAKGNPDYPFHTYAQRLTIREYCLHPATRWRIEDYQTVCLLTALWRTDLRRDCRYFDGPDYALHRSIEATTAQSLPAEAKFALAKGALAHFAAVGITERLDDSLALFSQALGVARCPTSFRENASKQRSPASELDSDTLATIHELTQADRLIYEYAKNSMAAAQLAKTRSI